MGECDLIFASLSVSHLCVCNSRLRVSYLDGDHGDNDDDADDTSSLADHWIFEPRYHCVHGNVDLGELLSEQTWPVEKSISSKGPYGQTGLYGKDQGPYSCITESDFIEGLQRSYCSLAE